MAFSGQAQTWMPVSTGITGTASNTTWSLFAYDSVLYSGGWFNNAGGTPVNDFAQWNGSNWSSVGKGTSGFINAITEYNGNVYVGGSFDTVGGIVAHEIGMWNGSKWAALGSGTESSQYGVYSMLSYKGNLYVGGNFDSAGGKAVYGVAQWNDTNWSSLGAGVIGTDEEDGVFAMAIYKGDLYIAGDFVCASGTNIAKWDGTAWSSVGGGTVGPIYSLAVYNGNLYAGGFMTEAGATSVNNIAMWDGTNWFALDSGVTGESGWASVNALASYNGELYVGGSFDTVNGMPINCIAKWNGTAWSPVGSGIDANGSVDAMTVYNNALYVGGGFDSAGGVSAKNIAMWTSPSAVQELNQNNEIRIYPNPVSNVLFVQTQGIIGGNYSIYNEIGQRIEDGDLNSLQKISIDVSSFSSGIYFVRVTANNGRVYNGKFIRS